MIKDKNITQRRKDTKTQRVIRPNLRAFAASRLGVTLFPRILSLIVILFFLRTLTLPVPLYAQDAVTFDEVNTVAEKLYCPVCPNETLKDCQTQACVQWRGEISQQLAAGQSEQQVIDSFVQRYGDRVVAIPQDAGLRALSVYTPYALAVLALFVGMVTLVRWVRRPSAPLTPTAGLGSASDEDDDYRARLERDLRL